MWEVPGENPQLTCNRTVEVGGAIDYHYSFPNEYRRMFVYTFCLINLCLSLSDEANKIKTQNIERA